MARGRSQEPFRQHSHRALCTHSTVDHLSGLGWGTDDSEQALSYVKRFGSVTVLNGHIHQIMQKIEGKVSFHTAMSTAFPQPAPGTAPSAGPMKVTADQLQRVLVSPMSTIGSAVAASQLLIRHSETQVLRIQEVEEAWL